MLLNKRLPNVLGFIFVVVVVVAVVFGEKFFFFSHPLIPQLTTLRITIIVGCGGRNI